MSITRDWGFEEGNNQPEIIWNYLNVLAIVLLR
jgi:hypothetical protein